MGGKFSRDKGARGEREAAKALKDAVGLDISRNARNGVDGAEDLAGLPGFAVEVKYNYQTPSPRAWWEQAIRNAVAAKKRPLLLHHQPRGEWIARVEPCSLGLPPAGGWLEMPIWTFGALVGSLLGDQAQ